MPLKKAIHLMLVTLLMSSLLFTANASSAESQTSQGMACEILYAAHPHYKAVQAVGENRLKQTTSLSFQETAAFSQAFMPLTQDIINSLVAANGSDIKVFEQALVIGGYEGESVTSVAIKTQVFNAAGHEKLLKLAAHIGYVYAQDSTLVMCEGNVYDVDKNWLALKSINIKDRGKSVFFEEKNVPIFFGMMIGAFNSPENVGFTFYKDAKVFSTLAGSANASKELAVVKKLASWLNELSNGDIELAIVTKDSWVFFPHNDWQAAPLGQSYKSYMAQESIAGLDLKRQRFLKGIDQFMQQKASRKYE
ncbi:hypothetical protein SAMN05216262_10580 [Colwellia chukchiensis]|uniref:Uncharacterized protein n=1 Tax=Colwellia chukchiensis TaxID=641665 RepID=A0A1H7M5L4_9GAMM|nr:hypothetical protein [Colwellia chukchiensis]SEL05867.1 hypothetical protein SAMN05216262_10580 [Colwellia chukchiensis]